MTGRPVIGRDADRPLIDRFLDSLPGGSAGLVVAGEAGIGKTTLWRAALEAAELLGFRVLVARPAESEARLSYSGLGDLLEGVADEVGALPEPQRRALEVALLKVTDDGNSPDQRAVSVAVLAVLRLLGAAGPVVVAIDDVQWLDHPSARVLHFALRRLGPSPVGVVVALRVGAGLIDPLDLAGGVGGGRLSRIEVGPLSVAAMHEVIRTQLGAGLTHPSLLRVHRASGGNPFFAIELVRALRGRESEMVPGQPLPVPEDLRALVAARLAALADDARHAAQVVAAMSQPTAALVAAIIGSRAGPAVTAAVEAGVIQVEGGRLRLAHPLLGSVVYYQCSADRRRDLHLGIAAAVVDPEERARHLALAASGPDAVVAAALDEASRVAIGRGAPDAAAELCELARRLTPADDDDQAWRRALRAARHHFAAGDWARAAQHLEAIIAATPPGRARAYPLRLLGELRYHHDFAGAVRLFEQALAEAGDDDDRLRASIELDLGAAIVTTSADLVTARAYAEAAVGHAERVDDPGLLATALAVAGLTDFLAGRTSADDRMARVVALEDSDHPTVLFGRPSFLAAMVWMWIERQDQARAVFERLYHLALDRGEESGLPLVAMFGAYLAAWMGDLDRAVRYARTSLEASAHVGGDVSRAAGLTAQAIVAAHAGDIEAARSQGREAAMMFQRAGWLLPSIWPAWAHGFVELSLGDPAAAHQVLGPISLVVMASGSAEAAPAPSMPDDIEALVALGDLDQAEVQLRWLEERGRRLDRAWALATAGRCRALLLAAQGDLDGAAMTLEAALVQHDRIPLPLERARTLLVKGGLERRRKHKAAAKQALDESLAIFETVGATVWAKRATSELARVGLRPRAPLELTATETKVAELAAAGLSTKQVAEQAFMSPRSVEGVLARVYRKLGVSSRAELANTMAYRRASSSPT